LLLSLLYIIDSSHHWWCSACYFAFERKQWCCRCLCCVQPTLCSNSLNIRSNSKNLNIIHTLLFK